MNLREVDAEHRVERSTGIESGCIGLSGLVTGGPKRFGRSSTGLLQPFEHTCRRAFLGPTLTGIELHKAIELRIGIGNSRIGELQFGRTRGGYPVGRSPRSG